MVALQELVAIVGPIGMIKLDNGKEFKGAFEQFCSDNGILMFHS